MPYSIPLSSGKYRKSQSVKPTQSYRTCERIHITHMRHETREYMANTNDSYKLAKFGKWSSFFILPSPRRHSNLAYICRQFATKAKVFIAKFKYCVCVVRTRQPNCLLSICFVIIFNVHATSNQDPEASKSRANTQCIWQTKFGVWLLHTHANIPRAIKDAIIWLKRCVSVYVALPVSTSHTHHRFSFENATYLATLGTYLLKIIFRQFSSFWNAYNFPEF